MKHFLLLSKKLEKCNEKEIWINKCLIKKEIYNFWEKYFYSIPIEILHIIKYFWNKPEDLFIEILPYFKGNKKFYFFSLDIKKEIVFEKKKIDLIIKKVKLYWPKVKKIIESEIKNITINTIYNRNTVLSWIKEIDIWHKRSSIIFYVPKIIKLVFYYFNDKEQLYDIYTKKFFQNINFLLKNVFLLKIRILSYLYRKIKINIRKNKFIYFNDIDKILEFNMFVRKFYHTIVINEFYRLNLNDFKIISKIKNIKIILICDPKNIPTNKLKEQFFNYIRIKEKVKKVLYFNLINKLSNNIIGTINILYSNVCKPFFLEEIKFLKIPENNNNLELKVRNVIQPSLNIWKFIKSKKLSSNLFQEYLINNFIKEIKYILRESYVDILKLNRRYKLKEKNIAIIVNEYNIAKFFEKKLIANNISTINLFNKKENPFQTLEAYEINLILKAILERNQQSLKNALSTKIFNLNFYEIYEMERKDQMYSYYYDKFNKYNKYWQEHGIYNLIKYLIYDLKLNKKKDNFIFNIRIFNILIIAEELQRKSWELISKKSLIFWLEDKICNSYKYNRCYDFKSLKNINCIKIINVNDIKYEKFEIIFFYFNEKPRKEKIINNKKNLIKKNKEYYFKMKLSENLITFYKILVNCTYQCNIFINNIYNLKTKNNFTDAIIYLLNNNKNFKNKNLEEKLLEINHIYYKNIRVVYFNENIKNRKIKNINIKNRKTKSANVENRLLIYNNKNLNNISYSKLSELINEKNKNNKDFFRLYNENIKILNIHNFPKGPRYGIFLHKILNIAKINNGITKNELYIKLQQYQIDLHWIPIIKTWIKNIFNTIINNSLLSLNLIKKTNFCSELKFYLSIKSKISISKLDKLCKKYDLISSKCPDLENKNFNGILKGEIDLLFFWQGKYYIVDYKSNWLGENDDYYSKKFIEQEIIFHRYDLQYQIYTLAIHRFLKQKLTDYGYEKHFGGVYYLFLRGMKITKPKYSIFYCLPEKKLIKKLDQLFSYS